jgi:hypothetical protein
MIGADVTFCQILDEILMEGSFPFLSKPDGLPIIKSKLQG